MATPNPEPVFVKELADKYKCSICTNLLDTPVLTECCGQHFCKACIEKWIIRKKVSICPHCRAENFNKIVSQPIIREIKELGVYCANRKNGCKAVINYDNFQKHVIKCLFGVVECTNDCGMGGLLRKDLKQHRKQECPNRIVHCELCNEEGKHQEIVGNETKYYILVGDHKRTCPEVILACPNKCNEKLKRKDIEEHRNECSLEEVDCPFKEAGCEVRLPRKDIPEHETTSMQSHLRLAMKASATVNTAMATVKRENKKLKKSHDELKGDLDTILSVVSTELSSMDIPSNNRKPMDGIKTILTSLTSMIRADGKTHCVHMSNKLGIFRDPELTEYRMLQASSPPLCIYPGFKIFIGFFANVLLLLLEKTSIHGYPQTLSIEVKPTTGPPFSFSLNDFTHSSDVKCDSGRELMFVMGDALPIKASKDFYANIRIINIS
ncbi:TNF receptor-associated factor 5-like [Halichondria panicea]|uniref:TNF receptor-associated factor 5-like n=1 Tax=Halichondria panicea TaxID=6063 RepID=UPI00312BBFD2